MCRNGISSDVAFAPAHRVGWQVCIGLRPQARQIANSAFAGGGFAVTSIRQVAPDFARCVSATWDGEIIYDPLQLTNSSFLRARATGQPAIELVEPTAQGSPLYRFVEQGSGLHHLCYEVESLEQQLRLSRSRSIDIETTCARGSLSGPTHSLGL